MPSSRAWYATPCAWLPADAATTPRARSSAERCARKLRAPRSLNDAVNCWFSYFTQSSAPAISDSVRECNVGVATTEPRMVSAAACTSAMFTTSRWRGFVDHSVGEQRVDLGVSVAELGQHFARVLAACGSAAAHRRELVVELRGRGRQARVPRRVLHRVPVRDDGRIGEHLGRRREEREDAVLLPQLRLHLGPSEAPDPVLDRLGELGPVLPAFVVVGVLLDELGQAERAARGLPVAPFVEHA